MLDRLIKIFTSLRLTVVLLAFGILLVFVGTIAQADEGLYQAQARYFKHWFVWGITMFGHKIPIGLPGGYLIGTLLLMNLTAAHIKRFQWTWKKAGIHLTHAGVILLLVGQLTTDLFSRETMMHFAEGETKSYSESGMDYELAFVTDVDADTEEVVAIPARLLAKGGELKHEKLPFTVRVNTYWPNSDPSFRAPMQQNNPPLATNGIAVSFDFRQDKETRAMDNKNIPTAILEFIDPHGTLGTWVASGWSGDQSMVGSLWRFWVRKQGLPANLAQNMASQLTTPQVLQVAGKTYAFSLRPTRAYEPYSLTLQQTTHAVYRGTEIPKDFRSRVRIKNPRTGEDREVEIYMNSPLRYAGLTYYQSQMDREELERGGRGVSGLQVVRNPSWLAPYFGCLIVAAGLIVQFMIHLVGFVGRRKTA
jgi:hypothetical protein